MTTLTLSQSSHSTAFLGALSSESLRQRVPAWHTGAMSSRTSFRRRSRSASGSRCWRARSNVWKGGGWTIWSSSTLRLGPCRFAFLEALRADWNRPGFSGAAARGRRR
jgi:hypothetical protein